MQFKPKLLLFILLLFAGTGALAQAVSLGDPVVNIDFGSNGNPKLPVTTYTYTTDTCPNDGSYSIGTSTSNCFSGAWHTVTHDHTGNPGGYMMIVNASLGAGEFFKQQTEVGALCENTTYEFSAYILNLIKGNEQAIKPNISFIIETPEGVQLKKYDTGDIPLSANADGWLRYFTSFPTPTGVTSVVIKMVNNQIGGNGNDLLLDDITFRAFGAIVQAGFSGDVSATQTGLCVGSVKSYHITSTPPTGYNNPRSQWQQNLNDGAGWKDIPFATNSSLDRDFEADAAIGSYQYRIGVAEGDNINSLNCRVYSNPVTIAITSYPIPPAPSAIPICEGETRTLTASGGATYIWTRPDMSVVSQSTLTISNATKADEGRYNLEVRSAAGCPAFSYVDVTVNLKPVVTIDPILPVCRGNGTQLTASVTNADPNATYSYSWLPATGLSDAHLQTPAASPNNSTQYTVTVTNNTTGCSGTQQVQVDVLDLPVAHAGNDKKIFEGQSVKLDGSAEGNVTYSWTPTDYLDDPHSPTPIATPPFNMPYLLTVTSADGCGTNADNVFVRVFQKIIIPSTFTPNNDGMNDIWSIEALETYPDGVISVFTRSGKQVFQSKGYGKPWDGKLNGTLLPAGTYYYVIDLKNDTPKLSGWVMLVR